MTDSLRALLKKATAPMHDQVEQESGMSRLLAPDLTPGEYAATLARMLSVYEPLEVGLKKVADLATFLPDLPARWKVEALRKDLRELKHPLRDQPAPAQNFASLGEAVGALYVIEGSTLGGRLITRALRTRTFINDQNMHFFEHYRGEGNAYWQTFTAALERLAEPEHAAAVQGAQCTFHFFNEVFSRA